MTTDTLLEKTLEDRREDLIGVRDAALLMGLSEATVYRHARAGHWPFVHNVAPYAKLPQWRISKRELLEYLSAEKTR